MRLSPSGGDSTIPLPVVDSRAAAVALRPILAERRRFALGIVGGGLKTAALAMLAVEACRAFGIPVCHAAVIGPTDNVAHVLKCSIATELKVSAPLDEIFFDHLTGSVLTVAFEHSWRVPLIRVTQRRKLIEEYVLLLKRAAGVEGKAATAFIKGRAD